MKGVRIFLVSFVILVISVFSCSIMAIGEDYSAFMADTCPAVDQVQTGDKWYYHNGSDNLVIYSGKWANVDYMDIDSTDSAYIKMSQALREKMVERKPTYSFIIATNRSEYMNEANKDDYFGFLLSKVYDNVYNTDGMTMAEKAVRGDYLRFSVENITFGGSGYLAASNYSPNAYYIITLNIEYRSTLEEQAITETFLSQFQNKFIDSNTLIQNAPNQNVRNYYIVKTIYNFLSENTKYDEDTHKSISSPAQYRLSHTAYGAIYGRVPNPTAYDLSAVVDSNGLTRLVKYDQGLSVCDGYALITYYLCQMNGIDCQIISGDYDASTGKTDPHAWNMIKLCDSDAPSYSIADASWYYFDATYSAISKNSIKLQGTEEMSKTFLDYSYFLRGTANVDFMTASHQIYDNASIVSTSDYTFKQANIDLSKAWIMITRRADESNLKEFESCYIINSNEGRTYYKYNEQRDGYGNLINSGFAASEDQFIYSGVSYYYFINIQDAVNGVEYNCGHRALINSGNHEFNIVAENGSLMTTAIVPIKKLDLSNSKRDNYSKIEWNDIDITNQSDSNVQKVGFVGSPLRIETNIIDNAGEQLVENTNYIVTCYDAGNNAITPVSPGQYRIVIDFDAIANSNYSGKFIIRFDIVKNDVKKIIDNNIIYQTTYGEDVRPAFNTVRCNGSDILFVKDVDYSVAINNDVNINVGTRGTVTLTALPSSKYLLEGTSINFYYDVTTPRDLSAFAGAFSKYSPNLYTGKPVVLESSQIKLDSADGTLAYTLYQGVDYDITGYSNNVNEGIATANIKFKGNFSGNTVAYYRIYPNNANLTGGNTGNGDVIQKPSTTVNTTVNNQSVQNVVGLPELTAIKSLKAKYNAKGTVTLSWKSQGSYVYYEYYIYDTAKKKWTRLGSTNATTVTVPKAVTGGKSVAFKNNSKYKFRVRSYFSATVNGTPISKNGSFTNVNAYIPVKSPKVKSATAGKKSFKLNWNKISGAKGYEIEYSISKKFKSSKKLVVKKGSAKSATIKKLTSKKKYYFRIRAYSTIDGKKVYSPYASTYSITAK